jgi:hypothetical protein
MLSDVRNADSSANSYAPRGKRRPGRREAQSCGTGQQSKNLPCTLVCSKLVYASVAWNSITSTDVDKQERIEEKTAALCFNHFFPHVHYGYAYGLGQRWPT